MVVFIVLFWPISSIGYILSGCTLSFLTLQFLYLYHFLGMRLLDFQLEVFVITFFSDLSGKAVESDGIRRCGAVQLNDFCIELGLL